MRKIVLSSVVATAVAGVLMLSGCGGSSSSSDEIAKKPEVDTSKVLKDKQSASSKITGNNIAVVLKTDGSDKNKASLGSTKVTMSVDKSECTTSDPCSVSITRKCFPNELNYNDGIAKAYEIADAAANDIDLDDNKLALRYAGFVKVDGDSRIDSCSLDFEIGLKCAVNKAGTKYYLMDNDPATNDYRVTTAAVAVKYTDGDGQVKVAWYKAEVEYKAGKRILKHLVNAADNTEGIKNAHLPAEVYVYVKQNSKQRSADEIEAGGTGASGGTGGIGG